MTTAGLEALRDEVARLERGAAPVMRAKFDTGSPTVDAALGGGLMRAGLHEIFAQGLANEPAAAAFAVCLALRASGERPVLWVRQDFVGLEMGEIYPPGLAELGLSPERLILVRARDAQSVLRAGNEAAHCGLLGAVLIEPWGDPKVLDLVATRRLSLAAARSNLPVLMVRAGGSPTPSAAETRWIIRSALSRPLEADAPGYPCFAARLVRDRAGAAGHEWIVEWNRDRRSFDETGHAGAASLSRDLVPFSSGGPDHSAGWSRRAG